MTGVLRQISRSPGGLPKLAIAGAVMLTAAGIEGDWQRNRKYHGGPNQAVLMIASELIDDLARQGFPVVPGSLGENLTVSGMDAHEWRAGQRFQIGGTATIELTKLRQPCLNLNVYGSKIQTHLYDSRCRRGDTTSPVWAKGGFYGKVLTEGMIETGQPLVLLV